MAVPGDEICVSAGTYLETLDFAGKDVRLIGVDGPGATLLDGDGSGPVVTFDGGETPAAYLEGFTVRGGNALQGGGLYIVGSSPTLYQLLVTENTATDGGGGAYLSQSDSTVERVGFLSNEAPQGAGVFVDDGAPTFERVTITSNVAGERDGGMRCEGGAVPVLDNVVFEDNQATEKAGALGGDLCHAVIRHTLFVGNEAEQGGALRLKNNSTLTMTHVLLLGNSAANGGALYLDSCGWPSLSHAAIRGNSATANGGGVFIKEGGATCEVTLSHVDLSDNSAGGVGGGIYRLSGAVNLDHANAWANTPDDYASMSDPTGTAGNITVDPAYEDTTPADPWQWNMHLSLSSDLIDAGDAAIQDPDGGQADIGPFGGEEADGWDLDRDTYPAHPYPGPYDYVNYPGQGWDCNDRDKSVYPGAGC